MPAPKHAKENLCVQGKKIISVDNLNTGTQFSFANNLDIGLECRTLDLKKLTNEFGSKKMELTFVTKRLRK